MVVWLTLTSDTPGRAENGNLLVARHWFFAYFYAVMDYQSNTGQQEELVPHVARQEFT